MCSVWVAAPSSDVFVTIGAKEGQSLSNGPPTADVVAVDQ